MELPPRQDGPPPPILSAEDDGDDAAAAAAAADDPSSSTAAKKRKRQEEEEEEAVNVEEVVNEEVGDIDYDVEEEEEQQVEAQSEYGVYEEEYYEDGVYEEEYYEVEEDYYEVEEEYDDTVDFPSEKIVSPPDPRRYLALWWESKAAVGRTKRRNQNDGTCTNTDTGAAAPSIVVSENADDETPNDRSNDDDNGLLLHKWEEELALAKYNCYVRQRIQDCRRRADEHRLEIKEHERRISDCNREALKWEQELHNRMVFPILLDGGGGGDRFWDSSVPSDVKCSREMAWALLKSDEELPIAFQKMIWMNPACPLRNDPEILLACINKGVNDLHVDILWTDELTHHRELVLACFQKCPQCLWRNDEPPPPLLVPYLQDIEALRNFAFAPNPSSYRRSNWDDGLPRVHSHFSHALFDDPHFMADLVVHLCRRGGEDNWARGRLKKALPHLDWQRFWTSFSHNKKKAALSKSADGYKLLNNVDFAIRVAEGLALLPPRGRKYCPVTYDAFTHRVRTNPAVILAYARIDGDDGGRGILISLLPPSLRRRDDDMAFWDEFWTVTSKNNPLAIYDESSKPTPCKSMFSSRALLLRLLEPTKSRNVPTRRLQAFANIFRKCKPSFQQDREINMKFVLSRASSSEEEEGEEEKVPNLVAPRWVHCRDFWTDLAEIYCCPCAAWRLLPPELAHDERLMWVWARRASPNGAIDWLADAVARFPDLGLLSDRQVLLNWLPHLCSDHPAAEPLRRDIPQECLDSSLWLDLFQTLDPPRNLLRYIPARLRSDPGIVDAQLRCSAKNDAVLADCYRALSPELQQRFLSHIVRAIQNSDIPTFKRTWREVSRTYNLHHVPEAALAILSKGASFGGTALSNVTWRDDPEFLLAVADATATNGRNHTLWDCCSDALRRDKGFLLTVLKGKKVPKLYLDDDLERDFDIQCALRLRHSVNKIRKSFVDLCDDEANDEDDRVASDARQAQGVRFSCKVRSRLQSYLSLETFMAGVQTSRSGAPSPASLLNQDEDTVIAFRQRLVAYLGCPTRNDALDLRRLSNKLTLAGY